MARNVGLAKTQLVARMQRQQTSVTFERQAETDRNRNCYWRNAQRGASGKPMPSPTLEKLLSGWSNSISFHLSLFFFSFPLFSTSSFHFWICSSVVL